MNFLMMAIHEAGCAAASADKATNAAAENTIAAQSAMKAATTAAALVLGAMTGEIQPVARVEGRKNGDIQIEDRSRSLD